VWDAETGQELFSLMGHTKGVNSVAVHPAGKCVLSGDWDAAIKVWDASKPQR
jgi:WD40 repeat protein